MSTPSLPILHPALGHLMQLLLWLVRLLALMGVSILPVHWQ
jgi:hypothetical protein